MQKKNPQEKKKQFLNSANSYVKYSALAFQMIGIIGICTFIGYKIDEYQQNKTPVVTGLLSLVGVIIALCTVFRDLLNKKP
ncbi:hypothetical protein Pedsa_2513 [Pseudopedobacter saltans DSM 12145]|uniref:F0F1-ATPase subunit n=1 Tax=Pseudopedobacter saltans (strain ATCC 51119 / DSM 12145 / JCM 21818 / CCUG 39354 / LMG 10337 / NBRC 100064 / NCIMB 13643) TaxID=762903 RepID=F0S4P0_PSESL|nr:AtpZ/AtpI family protein [Pseudopedobacter saltans]ADY53058.1 hypothetical protein Pedsa_2513 [Pseudopedobacter saltans DSM 12145]